jgi:O-antigen ligase
MFRKMFIPKTDKAFFRRQTYWEIVFFIFVAFPIVYLLLHGYLFKLAVLCLLGTCVGIAYRFPIFTVIALLGLAVLPSIFQMAPGYSTDWANIGGGIRIQDVVMISMVGGVLIKLFFPGRHKASQSKLGLSVFVVLFGLWILFEIARNVGIYCLSAPGEFRFRYLILSVPLYVCIFFNQEDKRKSLFKILFVCSVFLPLLCVPIIGYLKGWSVGADSRFFPSSISLGLLYGIIGLSLGQRHNLVRINGTLHWLLMISVGLLILFDTHRSVWLSGAVIAVTLFALKEISPRKIMRWSLVIFMSVVIAYAVASKLIPSSTGNTPIDFIFERSSDIVKFDEGYENTAAWRVAKWKIEIQKFYEKPIAGIGFGGYWGSFGEAVSPHSLYVQTLVKLGIVGMLLYLLIILKVFDRLRRAIARYKRNGAPEMAILITGLVVLIASHAFYAVYAFEYYSLLFIGLSVASLRDKKFAV